MSSSLALLTVAACLSIASPARAQVTVPVSTNGSSLAANILGDTYLTDAINSFVTPSTTPATTLLGIVETVTTLNGTTYKTLSLEGQGPQWQMMSGIGCVVIDYPDNFVAQYRNLLSVPELIHVHGQVPPYEQDGFPFISSAPMPPSSAMNTNFSIAYDFTGTYFVHSHYGMHYSNGVKAPFIIRAPFPAGYPNASLYNSATDVVMMFEEFCSINAGIGTMDLQNPSCFDTFTTYQSFHDHAYNNPSGILQTSYADPDSIVRDAAYQVNGGALPFDKSKISPLSAQSFENYTYSALPNAMPLNQIPIKSPSNLDKCQPPATGSIVRGKMQLANKHTIDDPVQIMLQPGEMVRLRLIDAASMGDYFVDFGGLTGIAVATDGHFMYPDIPSSGYWMAVAQRIDVMIQMPATPGHWLVSATTQFEPATRSGILLVTDSTTVPVRTYSADTTAPDGNVSKGSIQQDSRFKGWFGNNSVEGKEPLSQVSKTPNQTYVLNLTGATGWAGINGYNYRLPPVPDQVAHVNPYPIEVSYGDHVCVQFINHANMAHPFHLHGHKFQVVEMGGQVIQNGPIRDTMVVPAGNCSTATFCFDAIHPGVWPLHCHLEFHLLDGMITTVQYQGLQQRGIPYDAAVNNSQYPIQQTPLSFSI